MWRGKRVSVVFPTYNEEDSIRAAIEDYFATEYVDEVVVVDNNAAAGTRYEVVKTRALLVHEPRQGIRLCDPVPSSRSSGSTPPL